MPTRATTTRRQFIVTAAAALSAAAGHRALADDKLDPADPQAQAFGYAPVGADSERPSHDQRCGGCLHFNGEGEWGACNIFGARLVAAEGWCSAYVPRS